MFAAVVRLGVMAGVAYLGYRAKAKFDQHRYEEQQYTQVEKWKREEKGKRKCIICFKPVETSHKTYNSSCKCLAHEGCMMELIKEGQDVCPGCKKPLINSGVLASSSRSLNGTSTTRRLF